MSILGDFWFEVVPDKLRKTKKQISMYRRGKIAAHTTINGKGKIARLFKK